MQMKTQSELEMNLQEIMNKINKCTKEMGKAIMNNNREKIKVTTNEITQLDAKRQALQWALS